jgi:hypothetical protein
MNVTITGRHIKFAAIGLVAVIVIIFILVRYRSRRSNFQWPVPAGTVQPAADTASDTAFQNSLNTCQDSYNQALIGAGTDAAGILAAETTRSICVKNASSTYVSARCPVSTGTIPVDPILRNYYNTYQSSIVAIQQAYVPAQRTIAAADIAQLNAARKGDMAGATRKYIATSCPTFYKPSLATDPDPTTTYTSWATGDTVTNGFRPAQVTVTSIQAWADYAATTFTVSEYFKNAPTAANATVGPIKLTSVTGLVVGDAVQIAYKTPTTVSAAGIESAPLDGIANGTIAAITGSTVTITIPIAISTGFVLAADSVIAKALKGGNGNSKWKFAGTTTTPNWKLARDNGGPGTVPQPAWANA